MAAQKIAKLSDYKQIVGESVIDDLKLLAEKLKGLKIQFINSTRVGGGVAEILSRAVPLLNELGVDVKWDAIKAPKEFFQVTKKFHNALHGRKADIKERDFKTFRDIGDKIVKETDIYGDIVFVHDPQPISLIKKKKKKKMDLEVPR